MSSSAVALVLSLSLLALSKGLTKEAKQEFASGLLDVLDMERAPNISSHRHDIPRYILNLYRGKFTKLSDVGKDASLGSTTRIYFPQDLYKDARRVVLWFNLSWGSLRRSHRVRKAELHLQVHSGDVATVKVSIPRSGRSLKPGVTAATKDYTTIVSQDGHKLSKGRWLVIDLTQSLPVKVKKDIKNVQVIITTTHVLRISTKGKREPFLAVLTDPILSSNKLQPILPLTMSQHVTGNTTGNVGATQTQVNIKRTKRSDISNFCHKRRLSVRFRDLKWDDWIIAPPRFGFHYCDGHCPRSLSQQSNPSNHAILQNILHHRLSKKIPAATCVPTELHSMSLLYYEKDDSIVLQDVPGMVASNCGCR